MNPNTPNNPNLPSPKAIITTVASVAITVMANSIARDFIPHHVFHFFTSNVHNFFTNLFNKETTLIINEFDDSLNVNHFFDAAYLYLGSGGSATTTTPATFLAYLPEKEKKINVSIAVNQEFKDKFRSFELKWKMLTQTSTVSSTRNPVQVRYFALTFNKRHQAEVFDEYLPYIVEKSKGIKEQNKTLQLHTFTGDGMNPWHAVNLNHPANFETIVMDGEIKDMIINDLDMFLKRKELYRKVGKSWNRGYLLHGPPGTGKSSLIAAIANYTKFDVYDLELNSLRSNSDLRKLLISTANRSILVVDDIDALIDLSDRRLNPMPMATLSGLLNFIDDGLWSSIGDERIIIFTTNHIERLDPALLCPGRMDMHINMSYCTPYGFRMLVTNYIGLADHPLVSKAEALIASAKITPAEVGEQLLRCDDPGLALQGLIEFIERKMEIERRLDPMGSKACMQGMSGN